MTVFITRQRLIAASVLLGSVTFSALVFGRQQAPGQPLAQPPTTAAWADFLYDKSKECMECHAAPTAQKIEDKATDFVLLTESAIWRTHDKHAQAYAVLDGERGQQIGQLLRRNVLDPKTGCLSCHGNYHLLEKSKAQANKDPNAVQDFLMDGVSCTGCHGPSQKAPTAKGDLDSWFGAHQLSSWRSTAPDVKFRRGMRDLRDPIVRAELCMSCHIGNVEEGKVVTHAMMAAGHPALPPIELAAFSRNLPRHWRETRDVPWIKDNKGAKLTDSKGQPAIITDSKGQPAIISVADGYYLKFAHGQTRIALLGNVIAARETMKLVQQRADFNAPAPHRLRIWPELELSPELSATPRAAWPELALAHSDCFACHHELQVPGFRQKRGYGYYVPGLKAERVIPGRPMVRSWHLAGLTAAAKYLGSNSELEALEPLLNSLTKETNARPFGTPEGMGKAAAQIAAWCQDLVLKLHQVEFSRGQLRKLALDLCTLFESAKGTGQGLPDYEAARQLGSILRTACQELGLKEVRADGKTLTKLGELRDYLNLEPYINREARLDLMLEVIWDSLAGAKPERARFEKGFNDFKGYLRKLDLEQPFARADHDQAQGNSFLASLARDVTNSRFASAVKSKRDKFQALSDGEQVQVLNAVSRFDPHHFVRLLEALRVEIEQKK